MRVVAASTALGLWAERARVSALRAMRLDWWVKRVSVLGRGGGSEMRR